MMEKNTFYRVEQGQVRERWLWIGAFFLALLVFACVALITINTGPGWGSEDMKTRYHLVGIFTNIPDCVIADLPTCPPNPIVSRNIHWILLMDIKKETPTGIETRQQKLLDIPLLW